MPDDRSAPALAPRTMPARGATRSARPRPHRPESGSGVVRRAPFSDNPTVGARGQRTQQRILDAALRAFGDDGYHRASIDRVTRLARCSRVSFYQYFASKEDVFGHLASQVARQLSASTDALAPLTADAEGWTAMRAWVARYAEIYDRYESIFHAVEADDALAGVAAHTGEETIARFRARLATTSLPPRQLDAVIRLLLECLNHALGVAGILRTVVPAGYPAARVEVALTDVLHRTLFGVRAGVNVHVPDAAPSPPPVRGAGVLELLRQGEARHEPGPAAAVSGNGARAALLASGRDVFVARGYHHTRVDDLVAAAGISHGAFYRYFRNKDELARILAARALEEVGTALVEIPDVSTLAGPGGTTALRKWLRRYHAAHANEAAMLRVWVDAALADPSLRAESAPPLDWGRRRMARYLRPRGFGDVDMEAVVIVALLGVFGARDRRPADVEAAAHIVERGFLGR